MSETETHPTSAEAAAATVASAFAHNGRSWYDHSTTSDYFKSQNSYFPHGAAAAAYQYSHHGKFFFYLWSNFFIVIIIVLFFKKTQFISIKSAKPHRLLVPTFHLHNTPFIFFPFFNFFKTARSSSRCWSNDGQFLLPFAFYVGSRRGYDYNNIYYP